MLPKLYPILDSANAADAFFNAGTGILQFRAKNASPQEILAHAAAMLAARGDRECTLILNDRPDLALLAGFDGCHLGQEDLSIAGARKILPRPKILGLSTHNQQQIEAGNQTDADYLAIGPVFATSTKQNADPVVGIAAFARLRKLTSKPVVAIGGITRDNARSVLDAGADSVAIISDLYRDCTAENYASQLQQNVEDILRRIL